MGRPSLIGLSSKQLGDHEYWRRYHRLKYVPVFRPLFLVRAIKKL